MTTYTFKDITLEHDREWRAWRRLEWPRDLPFNASDEWRSGPNKWEPLGPVTNMGNVFDYRRPVPLPSIETELVDASWTTEHNGCWQIGSVFTKDRDRCVMHLRALLPGYEEQLSKVGSSGPKVGGSQEKSGEFDVKSGEQPSPVPADGWRPIETAPKDGTEFVAIGDNEGDPSKGQHAVVCAWEQGAFRQAVMETEYDYLPLIHLTMWTNKPLPPPPQEKGGEA